MTKPKLEYEVFEEPDLSKVSLPQHVLDHLEQNGLPLRLVKLEEDPRASETANLLRASFEFLESENAYGTLLGNLSSACRNRTEGRIWNGTTLAERKKAMDKIVKALEMLRDAHGVLGWNNLLGSLYPQSTVSYRDNVLTVYSQSPKPVSYLGDCHMVIEVDCNTLVEQAKEARSRLPRNPSRPENTTRAVLIQDLISLCNDYGGPTPKEPWRDDVTGEYKGEFFDLVKTCLFKLGIRQHSDNAISRAIADALAPKP